ncbi:hypothetical protein E2C01_069205 [Portunus trituberculatus]|uniref:Uncharacterized protein n=1 Tax=Portunus trituberculatus TaxID=210409 RepID=A0A5B7HYR5_PORTR|nr:hypothetical protein [Portunus trituberculatus]
MTTTVTTTTTTVTTTTVTTKTVTTKTTTTTTTTRTTTCLTTCPRSPVARRSIHTGETAQPPHRPPLSHPADTTLNN